MLKALFLLSIIILLSSCTEPDLDQKEPIDEESTAYERIGNSVFYQKDGLIYYENSKWRGEQSFAEVEEADPASFKIIVPNTLPFNFFSAKDKNRAYYIIPQSYARSVESVENINIETFDIIEGSASMAGWYASDGQGVYYYGGNPRFLQKIEAADSVTFEFIGEHYAKDKNNVYYPQGSGIYGKKVIILPEADPARFALYDGGYSSDGERIYLNGVLIKEVDAATFEVFHGMYIKDVEHVYYEDQIIHADPESFHVRIANFSFSYHVTFSLPRLRAYNKKNGIEGPRWVFSKTGPVNRLVYGIDRDSVYYEGALLMHNEGFEILTGGYTRNGEKVFLLNQELPFVDAFTFEALNSDYARDKNNAYLWGSIIPDADPETFSPVGDSLPYGKDTKNVFFLYNKIQEADPETFQEVSSEYYRQESSGSYNGRTVTYRGGEDRYYKDKIHVYYEGERVRNADPATFEYVGNFGDSTRPKHDGRDENHLYLKGEMIE